MASLSSLARRASATKLEPRLIGAENPRCEARRLRRWRYRSDTAHSRVPRAVSKEVRNDSFSCLANPSAPRRSHSEPRPLSRCRHPRGLDGTRLHRLPARKRADPQDSPRPIQARSGRPRYASCPHRIRNGFPRRSRNRRLGTRERRLQQSVRLLARPARTFPDRDHPLSASERSSDPTGLGISQSLFDDPRRDSRLGRGFTSKPDPDLRRPSTVNSGLRAENFDE